MVSKANQDINSSNSYRIMLIGWGQNLKGNESIFQNLVFFVSFEESSVQRCKFQISVETGKPFGCTKQFCILQLSISYIISLIMVANTFLLISSKRNTFQV